MGTVGSVDAVRVARVIPPPVVAQGSHVDVVVGAVVRH